MGNHSHPRGGPPIKTLDTKAWASFPVGSSACVLLHIMAGGVGSVHGTPPEEDNWEPPPGFPWTLPHAPVPFADLSLCPFAVINCNHEYKGISEFGDSFQQLMNLSVVLGTPKHNLYQGYN